MAEDEIRQKVTDEGNEETSENGGVHAPAIEGHLVELMRVSMNGEEFLIPVNEVSEILRPVSITPVPMAPDHVMGVANIHGQVVCIVDPGKVFHLKEERKAQSDESRYLILRHPRMHLGIWVDSATELFRVLKEALPEAESSETPAHVCGKVDVEGKSFDLLNTSALFE